MDVLSDGSVRDRDRDRDRRPGTDPETVADVPHGDLRGVLEEGITVENKRGDGLVYRHGGPWPPWFRRVLGRT
jgi:hypothetical protein